MNGNYDPLLVALSILVASFASYTALDLANSVAIARGRARLARLSAGAVAMGIGIWSMHFVGMLAFRLPGMAIAYDVMLAGLSAAVAIVASALALFVAGRPTVTLSAMALAALAMGAAIAGMHYIGMWSMRMPAAIVWNPALVTASIVIAVAASFVGLWLAYRYRLEQSGRAKLIRIGGGVAMGFAISGMHYTAMAAAHFVPQALQMSLNPRDVLATDGLAIAVTGTTLVILLVALTGSAISRELARRTALADENARLYRTAEAARREAEELSEELQLQTAHLEAQAAEFEAMNDELSTAESRLRGMVDSALDAMIVIDANSKVLEWNQHAEIIFGWSAKEAVGKNLSEMIIPSQHREAHQKGMERYLATGEGPILNRRIEITALRRDRREFPVELAVAQVQAGRQMFFTAFVRDITEQKKAEERERELVREQAARTEAEAAGRRISEILESITDVFITFDHEWRVTYANSRAEELTGTRRGELVGKNVWELYPDLRKTAAHDALQRAMSERVAVAGDYPSVLRPGAWFHIHAAPTSDGVATYMRDITAGKQAEEALAESQGELGAIIQGMRDVVIVMDADGRYREIAPTAAPLLHLPSRELIGKTLHEIFPVEVADFFLEPIRRALTTGGTEYVEYSLPIGDQTIWFDGAVAPMSEDRVVWVARDITERKQAEEVLRAAKEEAERTTRAKSEFLSRMSHELRTPLNAILGFGQLLEMEVEEDDDRESVDQVLKAGRHLLAMIDEVLDISRIEAGQMSLSVEPIPVRSVLQESVDLVRLGAAQQGITLRAQSCLATDHFVLGDQQRLKQALLNLLSNAIKYNRPAGTVTLSCKDVGEGRLRLEVRDTGYGIPAEKLERLFTPFDRLGADQTQVPGTGLGLALSKGLVEAMGGTLGVESVEDEGSCFWVELPLTTPPAVVEALPERQQVRIPGETADVTHTVLFIEDNLANVRLMHRIFQRRPGLRLLTAMQGSLGLELAREHRPDLILLDLNLPDLSGDKVLLQLRQDPVLRQIPVVMISGDAIPSQVQRMLDLGAQTYITKPFDVPELLRVVDENVQRGRS